MSTVPIAPLDGQALAATYDVVGREDGPTLVLLHGTRLTRAMWTPQVALANRYRLVMADLPGHGSLAAIHFSIPAATAHAARVIDTAAGGRAIVVGQSLGGYVAMDLAASHPERVAALVLCNCTAEPRTVARVAARQVGGYLAGAAAQSWRRRLAGRGGSGSGAPNGNGGDGAAHDADADDPEAQVAAAQAVENGTAEQGSARPGATGPDSGESWSSGQDSGSASAPNSWVPPHHDPPTEGWLFKGGTRALLSAFRLSFEPRLRTYPGPTLIVNGAGDRTFRREEERFLTAARDGRLVIIDGADHVASEENPAAFNAVVREFVDRVRRR